MTKEELTLIEHNWNAAIIAPAGHGKTEMVTEMVAEFAGKQLILTHTNAGVDALKKRFRKRKVSSSKYTVLTIAAFCMRWGFSYYNTAQIDTTLSPLKTNDKAKYYAQLYSGATKLFGKPWMGRILKASYNGVIVDEYQDCILSQHELIIQLNQFLPVRILGDPLQGIFGFKEPIVNWNNIGFKNITVKTYPWRWADENPRLGKYLADLRTQLLPSLQGETCTIKLKAIDGVIKIINPNEFDGYSLLPKLKQYEKVLYLTKWEREQLAFCKRMSGVFQQDEKQDCDLLFQYADAFDHKSGVKLLLCMIEFVSICATGVKKACSSYVNRLEKNSTDFSRIKKYPELKRIFEVLVKCKNADCFLNTLKWFEKESAFKFYRKELYHEMIRAIELANTKKCDYYDAAMSIRNDTALQEKYTNFKYLSSRTLLSKGLEFDCVIIDTSNSFTAKEFYVAMTRAKKMIYVISNQITLTLNP